MIPATQAGLETDLHDNPAYGLAYPVEGTVVAVYFPEDKENRSKRFIEYDVAPVYSDFGEVIKNAVSLLDFHSLLDKGNTLLRPAKSYLSGHEDAVETTKVAGASNTDGDRVLLQFINGSYQNPVITHTLPCGYLGQDDAMPPRLKGKAEILAPGPTDAVGYEFGDGTSNKTAADLQAKPGKRWRHLVYNGTHLAIDNEGNVFINFKEHPDTAADEKMLVIQNGGADMLRLEKTGGQIHLAVIGDDIELGESPADQHLIIGTEFRSNQVDMNNTNKAEMSSLGTNLSAAGTAANAAGTALAAAGGYLASIATSDLVAVAPGAAGIIVSAGGSLSTAATSMATLGSNLIAGGVDAQEVSAAINLFETIAGINNDYLSATSKTKR